MDISKKTLAEINVANDINAPEDLTAYFQKLKELPEHERAALQRAATEVLKMKIKAQPKSEVEKLQEMAFKSQMQAGEALRLEREAKRAQQEAAERYKNSSVHQYGHGVF